jgi:hypothetical protein
MCVRLSMETLISRAVGWHFDVSLKGALWKVVYCARLSFIKSAAASRWKIGSCGRYAFLFSSCIIYLNCRPLSFEPPTVLANVYIIKASKSERERTVHRRVNDKDISFNFACGITTTEENVLDTCHVLFLFQCLCRYILVIL